MKKRLAALTLYALALSPSLAFAGGNPGFVTGQVPTAAQWNSYFTAKEDELGYTPVNKAGDTMSGELVLPPGGTNASLNLTPGSTPSSLSNGDMWTTSAGLFVRVAGVTVGPLGTGGGGGGTPGGSNGQCQYNNAGAFGGFTVSGDGTLNCATGALLVTKTNGANFAQSAITDTTNANNINSGTLALQRLGSSYTNGQLLIGSSTDGLLHAATLTQGANVTITNTPAGITIASSGTGGGGCGPAGSAGQVLTDNGAGNCTSNPGLTYSAGTVTAGVIGSVQGSVRIGGSTSGAAILTTQAIAGSTTLTMPVGTDTLVARTSTDTLTNKTLTSPTIATIINGGTLSLPTSTDTIVARATTDTLTNKSIDAGQLTGTVVPARYSLATTAAFGAVKCDGSSILCTAGVISAPGSGGGTVNVGAAGQVAGYDAGTNVVKGYTLSASFVVDNTGHTIGLSVPSSAAKVADYTFAAGDMGGYVNLGGSAAHNLTVPVVTSSIFNPLNGACYNVEGTGTWTLVIAGGGPTITGIPSLTLKPGAGGCLVADSTASPGALHWQPGSVGGDLFGVNTLGSEFTNTSNTLHIASGSVTGTMIQTSVALGGNPTTTTQSAATNNTTVATTQYVDALKSANLTISGTRNFTNTLQINGNTMTFPGAAATLASLTTSAQTLSGGANVTSGSLGTVTTGTTTINCGTVPLQFFTNGGASTIAAPANDGSCVVLMTNNGSAGAITFSGFSVGSSTGDALTTTNAQKFSISIWRINSVAGYRVAAMQ